MFVPALWNQWVGSSLDLLARAEVFASDVERSNTDTHFEGDPTGPQRSQHGSDFANRQSRSESRMAVVGFSMRTRASLEEESVDGAASMIGKTSSAAIAMMAERTRTIGLDLSSHCARKDSLDREGCCRFVGA